MKEEEMVKALSSLQKDINSLSETSENLLKGLKLVMERVRVLEEKISVAGAAGSLLASHILGNPVSYEQIISLSKFSDAIVADAIIMLSAKKEGGEQNDQAGHPTDSERPKDQPERGSNEG